MSMLLPFGGAPNGGSRVPLDGRGRLRDSYNDARDSARHWAPRSTLLLAAGVSSVFWIVLGWLIAVNL
jgi:hypothetical protein